MTHDERVQAIAADVRARTARRETVSLSKAAVSHFVPNPHDPRHSAPKVSIRDLNSILAIDPAARTCVAEPGVTFVDLVRETLKHGLVPMLVPELKTITIGGAVSGCSVESLSYRHGGFHDSALEYEVVTGTGDIVICSQTHDGELFHMMHSSYGTLGILTKLTFKLIPAKPFVRMDYVTFERFEDFRDALLARCADPKTEFVDGIIHSKTKHVLCLGSFVDTAPHTSDYTFLKIFYKSTATRTEDFLTTPDYFFRYDTECHWLSRRLPLPGMETKFMRFLFGKLLLGSTNVLNWARRLRALLKFQKHPDVVIDLFIPSNRWDAFNTWYARDVNFYPLWIVPYRCPAPYPWLDDRYVAETNDLLYIDCAIYGLANNRPDLNYYKVFEEKVFEWRGMKALIAKNFYDEATFWKIYNRPRYSALKARIDPHGVFKGLYEKFNFAKT
ncbi:MAG: FAD-binding oxidoreductase [Deltaproteobacteria bacterium]|nr:FAD-binding oxidoreductase [Deltaproteobacteria bacterium]